jgi:hypothetical protein
MDQAMESDQPSTTRPSPKWPLRPSNFLNLLGACFFIYEWPGRPLNLMIVKLRSDLWLSVLAFCFAFALRRWENQSIREFDDLESDEGSKNSSLK